MIAIEQKALPSGTFTACGMPLSETAGEFAARSASMGGPATRTAGIRSVERAIDVLQALNLRPASTLDDLHRSTGIPKPTLVRLLRTLELKGLAAPTAGYGSYQLLGGVRSLASGFHHEPQIVFAAESQISQFTRSEGWPLSLALFDMDAVVVRACTINQTSLSLEHAALNRRLSLVTRALGRAYLAFSPAKEREILLNLLRTSHDPEDAGARDEVAMARLVERIRRNGYATRDPLVGERSSTLAVPVLQGNRTVATLGLTWISAAMSEEEAVDRYLAKIRLTAARIASAMEEVSNIDRGKVA